MQSIEKSQDFLQTILIYLYLHGRLTADINRLNKIQLNKLDATSVFSPLQNYVIDEEREKEKE